MNKGYSSEMVSTVFSVGWFYLKPVRTYLNDLIENKGWPIKYEESIGFFENKIAVYGTQRDVMYIHHKVEQYFKTFSF